jgi:hypothetical protein
LKDLKLVEFNQKSLQLYIYFDLNDSDDNQIIPFYNQKLEFLSENFVSNQNFTIVEKNSNRNDTMNKKNKYELFIDKNIRNFDKTEKKFTFHQFSNEKLWFLTNGSLRPDPLLSKKLAIWPNEGDPNDDRIVNQLMYVPLGYSQWNSELKKIYVITDDNDWDTSPGSKEFNKCPVNSCELVNKSLAQNADLIFFKV